MTWGEIKARLAALDVRDDDIIYSIDIGPAPVDIYVNIEQMSDYIEVRSLRSAKAKMVLRNVRVVEIGDDPLLVQPDAAD